MKGTLITIASMAVAVIVAMATIQSTQASIDFWLEKPASFTSGLNHITVYCENGGGMDGDFNLVVKFTNAIFSNQTELPYIKVDESTVKIKFVLHQEASREKTIYFEALNGTQNFSVSVSLEKASFVEFIKANQLFPTSLSFQWNTDVQVYNCTYAE
jgi:hypothetical protein